MGSNACIYVHCIDIYMSIQCILKKVRNTKFVSKYILSSDEMIETVANVSLTVNYLKLIVMND